MKIMMENDASKEAFMKYVSNVNSVWSKIKEIKKKYDQVISSIYDLSSNHGWMFNTKLRDAAVADNAEQDFEFYAENTWDNWVESVESITGLKYTDVMQSDNHNGSYFKFKNSFSLLCDTNIDFSNFTDFVETLSNEGIIGDYDDEDLNSAVTNDEIDINKFIRVFSSYDDNGLEYIQYLYNDLNNYVLSDISSEITQIEEIVNVYNSIKENQLSDIESYKAM